MSRYHEFINHAKPFLNSRVFVYLESWLNFNGQVNIPSADKLPPVK
jgi:hypothetical protein